jgi:hypothetical protein
MSVVITEEFIMVDDSEGTAKGCRTKAFHLEIVERACGG